MEKGTQLDVGKNKERAMEQCGGRRSHRKWLFARTLPKAAQATERQLAAGCGRRRKREGPWSVDGRLFHGGSKTPAKRLRHGRSLELCPRGVSPVLLKYIKTPRYIKKGDCRCCPVLSGSSSGVAEVETEDAVGLVANGGIGGSLTARKCGGARLGPSGL